MPVVSDYQACKVPLRTITVFGHRLVCHEGIVGALLWIEMQWALRGGHDFYRITSIGCYNCRPVTGGSSWSKHAWAVAVDVNPPANPYTSGPCKTDMPRAFADLWLAAGFGWGCLWTGGHRDAMHFSKFPNEGGNGKLFEYPISGGYMGVKEDVLAAMNEYGRDPATGQSLLARLDADTDQLRGLNNWQIETNKTLSTIKAAVLTAPPSSGGTVTQEQIDIAVEKALRKIFGQADG